jgi:hypothetical protein
VARTRAQHSNVLENLVPIDYVRDISTILKTLLLDLLVQNIPKLPLCLWQEGCKVRDKLDSTAILTHVENESDFASRDVRSRIPDFYQM